MNMTKILIADDDKNICELLRLYLEKEGYEVLLCNNGKEAIDKFNTFKPNLVLLDVMMPIMDGWHALAIIRKKYDTPVMMLTAKGEVADKVYSLNELSADDYIVKPFDMNELIARIKAVLRRTEKAGDKSDDVDIEFDNIFVSISQYKVKIDDKNIEMPPKELELLYHLIKNKNKVFTRDQLLDEGWGFEYFGDSRTVDVHIKRLREKLDGHSDKWALKTVWGVGYKFETTVV